MEPTQADAGAAKAAAPSASRAPRWRRIAVVLVVVVAVGALAYGPLVRWLVVSAARERGIELAPGEIELGWSRVQLRDLSFALIAVQGFEGKVAALDVELAGGRPIRLTVQGVELALVGSALPLALMLSAWAKAHPALTRVPAEGKDVRFEWRSDSDADPWFVVAEANIRPGVHGGHLDAGRAKVVGVDVGPVGAVWAGSETSVALGFGTSNLDDAPVTIDVDLDKTSAVIALRPTPLKQLAGPIGVLLPVRDVVASGRVEATMSDAGSFSGTIRAKLEGYRPPVPKEVGEIVFGDTTELHSDFSAPRDLSSFALTDMTLEHGAFRMKGQGRIQRKARHALVSLELNGQLACKQLASAAARSHLGRNLGTLLGRLAGQALRGSVAVGLRIDADTRDLANARMKPTIGVGCGLKSFKLPKLELPKIPDMPPIPQLSGDEDGKQD